MNCGGEPKQTVLCKCVRVPKTYYSFKVKKRLRKTIWMPSSGLHMLLNEWTHFIHTRK